MRLVVANVAFGLVIVLGMVLAVVLPSSLTGTLIVIVGVAGIFGVLMYGALRAGRSGAQGMPLVPGAGHRTARLEHERAERARKHDEHRAG